VGGSVLVHLAYRHGEQVEARLDAWLADRLPAGMDEERRRRVAGWVRRGAGAALIFAVLRFGVLRFGGWSLA
jgi:hypothetical protein